MYIASIKSLFENMPFSFELFGVIVLWVVFFLTIHFNFLASAKPIVLKFFFFLLFSFTCWIIRPYLPWAYFLKYYQADVTVLIFLQVLYWSFILLGNIFFFSFKIKDKQLLWLYQKQKKKKSILFNIQKLFLLLFILIPNKVWINNNIKNYYYIGVSIFLLVLSQFYIVVIFIYLVFHIFLIESLIIGKCLETYIGKKIIMYFFDESTFIIKYFFGNPSSAAARRISWTVGSLGARWAWSINKNSESQTARIEAEQRCYEINKQTGGKMTAEELRKMIDSEEIKIRSEKPIHSFEKTCTEVATSVVETAKKVM